MSAGGSIAAMISSMKNNRRRKNKNKPFSKYEKVYTKSQPIKSKEYTRFEKELLTKKLSADKKRNKNQHFHKLLITFGITIIVISTIVFLIKFTFF